MKEDPEKEAFKEDLKEAGIVILVTIGVFLAMCGAFALFLG